MESKKILWTTSHQSKSHEQSFHLLFQNHPIPMWVCDSKTLAFLDVNRAGVEKYGYTSEEFLEMALSHIQPQEDVAHLLDEVTKVRLEAQSSRERRHRLKDGRIIDVEITSHTMEYDGRDAVLMMAMDITERKRMEEALRYERKLLRLLIDNVPDLMYTKDTACRKTLANLAEVRHLGAKSEAEILGKDDFALHPRELAEGFFADDQSVLQTGQPLINKEEYMINENGQKSWLLTSKLPLQDERGQIIGLVGIGRDITERRRMEETLRYEHKLLRLLIDNIPDTIYTKDTACRKTLANLAEVRHLGAKSEAEVLGKDDFAFHPMELAEGFFADDQYVIETGQPLLNKEEYVLDEKGRKTWLLTSKLPLRDESGKIIGLVGIGHDITERKETEERIKRLNEELEDRVIKRTVELEAANKELEAFSYSVSHDLGAPLRHASGYVDLLMKRCKPALSEKGQHYLDAIADSVHQMGTLINDLLQFSRTGRTEMRQSISDMNEIVHEVLDSLSRYNSIRRIEWIIGKLPSVFCDRPMLKLVWMNLLSNAVKFTRTRECATIEIGVQEDNKEFVFFVRDNGVGFDMRYAQKLFGVFQRLHSVEEFEGTGIGLANVRRIISRHEGRTWAEAETEKGATFYFTLPKQKKEKRWTN